MPDDPQGGGTVHLPALLSSEFGISRSVARQQVVTGMIEVGGQKWEGDPLDLPIGAINGKEIVVMGRDRHFKFVYKPDALYKADADDFYR